MKKILMSLAVVATMIVAASCACNNNSDATKECAGTECADCDGCDKVADACCDKEGACEQTKACDKHCDKHQCDKQCDKQCEKHGDKQCDKQCEKHGDKQCEKKGCCDSTKVDCKKAE